MKYGLSILIIVLGGWLVRLIDLFVSGSANTFLVTFTIALVMFGFGISLQPKRKNKTWLKKLLVSFAFLFLLLYDLGYLSFPFLNQFFHFIITHRFVYYLIYIFLGWLFFD